MRVDNLKWHPVRLSLTRNASHSWHVSREGQLVGSVAVEDGQWYAAGLSMWGAPPGHPPRFEPGRPRSSFRAAVLSLTRDTKLYGMYVGGDKPQDYGLVHMLRVNIAGNWFTVIRDSVAGSGAQYVYEDFTIDSMGDMEQANMRKALAVVRRWEADQ